MNRRHFFTLALSAVIAPSISALQDDSATITPPDGPAGVYGPVGANGAMGPEEFDPAAYQGEWIWRNISDSSTRCDKGYISAVWSYDSPNRKFFCEKPT